MIIQERQYALTYTLYMVIEQAFVITGGKCRTHKSTYFRRVELAWCELPESIKEEDSEKCDELYDSEIERLFTPDFYEECDISIVSDPIGGDLSTIEVQTKNVRCLITITITKHGEIGFKKFVVHQ